MTDEKKTIGSLYKKKGEFVRVLSKAKNQTKNQWENEFVKSIFERFEKYGGKMFISPKQLETIQKIAYP